MKKLLAGMMAAFMIFAVAGTASAAFERGNTILSGFVGSDNTEVGIDLGDINLYLNETNYELKAAGTTFGMGDFGSIDSLSDVKFGAYSNKVKSNYNFSFALNAPLENVVFKGTSVNSLDSAVGSLSSIYTEKDTDENGVVTGLASSDLRSFYSVMGYLGNYALMNTDQQEYGNSSIDPVLGYVDMYLYEWNRGQIVTGPDATTQYKAVLRVNLDGSIVLNPTESAVPVPSAAILMAFGLIGLVGLRRK
ncbi:MAG: hypothetical protein KKE62_13840 [Proteobacteria bacterium]|nr:hypothetical protein [Pseudomonadota bacterium]MBU1389901.1 hypothetical protein [Pseudomonadota bacterium]MBU1543910.1 hypothetical protein [Pseudomonadota bacterium]MBU2429409.1 hypothetical protein [Pseudomonadota bacterium]MBU2482188.1 hypothetical protein [Pseudomonadota bacterium]